MRIIRNNLLLLCLSLLISCAASAQKIVQAKEKFAKFGDIKVHYQDQGKGKEALIFVHCWSCNIQFWKDQFTAFPDEHLIFIDLPGHGKSDKPKVDYTMEYFARAVEAVIKDAGVKKAVLVGHSMGTPVIRNFYKLFPDKTLGLVVVDGPLRMMGTKEQNDQFEAQMKADYQKNVPQMLDFMLGAASPELKTEIKTNMMATPEYVGLSAMKSLDDPNSYPPEKINVPVLVFLADSGFWPPDTEDFIHSIAPKVKIHRWQGVDHFLYMEKPKVFTQSLGIFLASNHLLE